MRKRLSNLSSLNTSTKSGRLGKRKEDEIEAARRVVDAVVSHVETKPAEKNAAAVALGRLGGRRSAAGRMEKIPAKTRSEIARNAARARWQSRAKTK